MNLKPLIVALLAVSLSACAQSQGVIEPSPVPVTVAAAKSILGKDVLYQILLGEIASQRGELRLSAEAYADLAARTRDPKVAKRAVELAQYARQSGLALRNALLWRELEPGSPQAMQSAATLLLASGRIREAKPHLDAWLKSGNATEIFPRLHGLFARVRNKPAALDLMNDLAAAHPGLPEARLATAQVALQGDNLPRALAALDEALQLRPQWEHAALLKAQTLHKQDGEARAHAYLRDFLEAHPAAREVRLAYAKQLARSGRFQESRSEFERLAQDAPQNPDAWFTLGLIAMQTNDFASARSSLSKSLELGYADADTARYYLGQMAEADDQVEAAMQWYRLVADGRHRFTAQLRIASLLGRQGKVQEARDWLAGLEVAGDIERVQVIQAEAMVLRDAKQHALAYEVLSRGLDKLPDNPELLYDRAMAAEKLDRLDVLEKDLRQLIKQKPDHAHAYNALGYTLADRTERSEEAMDLLKQALKLAPEDPFILDSMGWALFKQKRFAESIDYLRRAQTAKDDPEIAAHLGEVLWSRNGKGDRDEARRIWQRALKSAPDNESLHETITRLSP